MKNTFFQHYKGGFYKVLFEVIHSETLEEMVVYVMLKDGSLWTRPKDMFEETVVVGGKKVPRFKKIDGEVIITPPDHSDTGQ